MKMQLNFILAVWGKLWTYKHINLFETYSWNYDFRCTLRIFSLIDAMSRWNKDKGREDQKPKDIIMRKCEKMMDIYISADLDSSITQIDSVEVNWVNSRLIYELLIYRAKSEYIYESYIILKIERAFV